VAKYQSTLSFYVESERRQAETGIDGLGLFGVSKCWTELDD